MKRELFHKMQRLPFYWKAVLLAGILIVFYSWYVVDNKPELFAPQGILQRNKMTAEFYLLNDFPLPGVILGSSLGTRLKMEHIPGFYNLSLGGLSIYDGLILLHAKKKIPPIVLIESNVLLRFESSDIKNLAQNSRKLKLHKKWPVFRIGKEPLNILVWHLEHAIPDHFFSSLQKWTNLYQAAQKRPSPKEAQKSHLKALTPPAPPRVGPESPAYQASLALQIKENSRTPDPVKLKKAVSILRKNIQWLQGQGSKVAFFEMPMDPRICHLKTPRIYREILRKEFPEILFVPMPNCADYETTDAVHLSPQSAHKYSKYLYNYLHNNISSTISNLN